MRLRGGIGTALLIAFAAVDALLVSHAMRTPHPPAAASPAAASNPVASAAPVPASPTPTPSAPAVPPELLTAASGSTVWRADGGCAAAASLDVSKDNGSTWTAAAVPAAHLLRVVLTTATAGWAIGADPRCRPAYYATSDAGKTWQPADLLRFSWYIDNGTLHTPFAGAQQPCRHGTTAVSPASAGAALAVCGDGSLARTADGGQRWTPISLVSRRVVAAARAGTGASVALAQGDASCSGLRVYASGDGGATWSRGNCLSGARTPAAVTFGSGTTAVAVTADTVFQSSDAGQHWH